MPYRHDLKREPHDKQSESRPLGNPRPPIPSPFPTHLDSVLLSLLWSQFSVRTNNVNVARHRNTPTHRTGQSESEEDADAYDV